MTARKTAPALYRCERCAELYRWNRTRLEHVPRRAWPERDPVADVPFVCSRCERDGARR